MTYTADFLAKNNKNFRNIVEAVSPRGLLAAMQGFSAVEMVQVAMMSPLVHKEYTEKVRKITGDFSSLVVRDTIGKSDNEYLVVRYDSFNDGSCGKWYYDGRFGLNVETTRKEGTTSDALDALWSAFDDLVDGPYDMYYENEEQAKNNLKEAYAQAVILSKVLGAYKASQMFSFCVEDMNRFEVVSTEATGDELGEIVLHDSKGHHYHVGSCACGRKK
jgi:hypothetical protein